MDLSVVVIEYHNITEIEKFVKKFAPVVRGVEQELIVSSNSGYGETEQKQLIARFPSVRWVFNPWNGGFAYGMNRGLEVAKGDFLMISNPDVFFRNPLLPALEFLKQNPNAGALGMRMIDDEGHLQDTCRKFMFLTDMISRQWRRVIENKDVLLEKNRDYNRIQKVDWVIGACILLKREVYQTVGGLDEAYFLYVEDMDWIYRMHLKGYEIYYYPEITTVYKSSRRSTKLLSHHQVNFLKYSWYHLQSFYHFVRKFGLFGGKR